MKIHGKRRKTIMGSFFFENGCTTIAFTYSGYSKLIQEMAKFEVKDCLSLPTLGLQFF